MTHNYHRKWFIGQSKELVKDQGRSSIPYDRFAGHGSSSNPTKMPGYYDEEQKAVQAKYMPQIIALKENIYTTEKNLKDEAKSSEWPALKKLETEDRAQLRKLYSEWFSSDAQVRCRSSLELS
jgi:hypothetical protein